MRRIFDASPGVDLLLNTYSKEQGVKLGKIVNNAVLEWFLPTYSETLAIEARFLIDRQVTCGLNQFVIKQSVSRGITWLSKYPIKDCSILRSIMIRFARNRWSKDSKHSAYTRSIFDRVMEKIRKVDPEYTQHWDNFSCLGDDILTYWDTLWNDIDAYDALSTIVYLYNADPEISCYEAICYLRRIEQAALKEHGIS